MLLLSFAKLPMHVNGDGRQWPTDRRRNSAKSSAESSAEALPQLDHGLNQLTELRCRVVVETEHTQLYVSLHSKTVPGREGCEWDQELQPRCARL